MLGSYRGGKGGVLHFNLLNSLMVLDRQYRYTCNSQDPLYCRVITCKFSLPCFGFLVNSGCWMEFFSTRWLECLSVTQLPFPHFIPVNVVVTSVIVNIFSFFKTPAICFWLPTSYINFQNDHTVVYKMLCCVLYNTRNTNIHQTWTAFSLR